MTYLHPNPGWRRTVAMVFYIPCILMGYLASAELVGRLDSEADSAYMSGVEIVATNDQIYFIYKQSASVDYKSNNTRFKMEVRSMDQLDVPIWHKYLAELPGVAVEHHRQKWSLAADEDSIYLLGNSTVRGRSHLLFHFNARGQILSTKALDGFMLQKRVQSTPYGLFIAFYDRILALDKDTFDLLAVWNHPAPTPYHTNLGPPGEIVDMKIEDQEIIALEFRGAPWPGDDVPDKISGTVGVVRLSPELSILDAESKLATIDTSYSYKDFNRNMTLRGFPEMLAVGNDQTFAVAMINASGEWVLCEISRDPPSAFVSFFGSSCNEIEQTSGLDAQEVRLSLVEIPGGGYLWGVPSKSQVILGIHTAQTRVQTLDIEDGIVTAVRLAANKDWIFALVDVAIQSETGTRRFIELHRLSLFGTNSH